MKLCDTHCHLDPEIFPGELPNVLARAREAGVVGMCTIGSHDSPEWAARAVALARAEPDVVAAVGIHPHSAQACTDAAFQEVADLARDPAVAAVGETGLDYHYDLSPRDAQAAVFRRFVRLAHEVAKPLVVHVREAFQDCFRILDEEGAGALRVVIHCFTGTRAEAEQALTRGFFLSIPGVVTFKRAGELPDVVAAAPLDRLLVETDCPYLAPVPRRGRRNEPAYVAYTARRVAELRGMDPDALAAATTLNALRFFGL